MLAKYLSSFRRFLVARKLGFFFLRTKNFLPPKSIRIADKNYKIFFPQEKGISELFRDIILDDEYWLKCIPVHEVKTILDVGANVGIFSLAARIRFPKSTIIAFEPNTAVKPYLDQQAATFDFSVFYQAIGANEGKGDLVTNAGCDTAARISPSAHGNVKITSLSKAIDKFENSSIDLLKLDCEGFEHQIIDENGQNGPLINCRYLSMEYHFGHEMNRNHIIQKLEKIGFEVLKSSNRNQVIGNILAKRL